MCLCVWVGNWFVGVCGLVTGVLVCVYGLVPGVLVFVCLGVCW